MTEARAGLNDADLNGYIDGQLDPHRAAEVAVMLDADPKARARIDGWKKQNEALRTIFASIVFEPVPMRLMPTNLAKPPAGVEAAGRASTNRQAAASRQESSRQESPRQEPLRQEPAGRQAAHRRTDGPPMAGPSGGGSFSLVGSALAAFLLGIAVTFGVADYGLGPRLLSGLHLNEASPLLAGREIAKRAAEAHQTFATDLNRPVEIPASDELHLVKWIQHRLTMPIRIPDLHRQGWNLIGGRVVPGELGPAAFLVYGNGVERLGLYIARTNAPQDDNFSTYGGGTGNASVGYWIDEPFGYAITTSRSANWLERNGPSLYDSVKAQARDNASAF